MFYNGRVGIKPYTKQEDSYTTEKITSICPRWNKTCKNYADLPCVKSFEKFINITHTLNDKPFGLWIDNPNEMPWCEYWR